MFDNAIAALDWGTVALICTLVISAATIIGSATWNIVNRVTPKKKEQKQG